MLVPDSLFKQNSLFPYTSEQDGGARPSVSPVFAILQCFSCSSRVCLVKTVVLSHPTPDMSFWILDHVSQTLLSAISYSSLRSPEHWRLRTLTGRAEVLAGGAEILNKGEGSKEGLELK